MTDYNNGEWHSWNGGPCPVHPKSVVDCVWHDDDWGSAPGGVAGVTVDRCAGGGGIDWSSVVRFRVTFHHPDPRECWTFGSQNFKTEGEAKAFKATMIAECPDLGFETTEIIHMREVTK